MVCCGVGVPPKSFCVRVNKHFIVTPSISVVCKLLCCALRITSARQTPPGFFRKVGHLVSDPGVEGRDGEYTK